MSAWSSFPFVRITLAFIGGILAAYYFSACIFSILAALLFFFIIYLWLIRRLSPYSFYQYNPWVGCCAMGCLFLTGALCVSLHKANSFSDHLMHWHSEIDAYQAMVLEDVHAKEKTTSVTVAVQKAFIKNVWQPINGKVKLYLSKADYAHLIYGDVLLIRGTPQCVSPPRNPYEFDYKKFLNHENVFHQHFIKSGQAMVMHHKPRHYFKALSLKMRRHLESILARYLKDKAAYGIVRALLLGIKDDLDNTVREAYTSVGAMHILAVSGLHVGMLYVLLGIFFGCFKRIRHFSWAFSLVILWLYAFITGLSPSVMRATTMFTFVMITQMTHRQYNLYNALAASAFLLLLFDPFFIFSVGLQLSYLAVLGIVCLQPKIYRWFTLRHAWLDKVWLLSSVSLAAQIATTPITLYYFHQFPVYFLLANWVVVPAALPMLGLGFLVLLTSPWQGLATIVAWVLEKIIGLVNGFIFLLMQLPGSQIKNIFLVHGQALLLYGLIFMLLAFLQARQFKYLVAASITALSFFILSMQGLYKQIAQKKIIFYSIDRYTTMAFVAGHYSVLWVDDGFKTAQKKYSYHVAPHQLAMGVPHEARYTLGKLIRNQAVAVKVWQGLKIFVWQKKKCILIDTPGVACLNFSTKFKADVIIVESNAIPDLSFLTNRFNFEQLVVGTTNTKRMAGQLKKQAEQQSIACHVLQQQGALVQSIGP